MPRLFVAVPLPDTVVAALAAVRPEASVGVRPIPADRVHLTLHFLGEADIDSVRAAIVAVPLPRCTLTVRGVGTFRGADGGHIFWARVLPDPALLALHRAVGDALGSTGFVPEQRAWQPHVTLARGRPGVPREAVDAFLARGATLEADPTLVDAIQLYSSRSGPAGPLYTVEARFPIVPAGTVE
jgi:2'-5' RNA ligase